MVSLLLTWILLLTLYWLHRKIAHWAIRKIEESEEDEMQLREDD